MPEGPISPLWPGTDRAARMTTLLLREGLCRLFRHPDPTHCVLTAGNTMGLNMALRGALKPGDHCLVSAMEHNAVMRPLQDLADQGVSFDRIPCDSAGRLDPADILTLLRPNTRLLVMAHGSNTAPPAAAMWSSPRPVRWRRRPG